jgi:ATP-dependent helicase/DNAse subunit B
VDNERRYARDAYALSVLAASRERLTLVAGRFSSQGDPLTPSRLLFACDAETAAERARVFFDERRSAVAASPAVVPGVPEVSAFVVPRPIRMPRPPDYMSVTAFRAYLACPYRFYLTHILKLGGVSDTQEEMDAAAFGSLIHDVLRRFGDSSVRDSTNEDEIVKFLRESLDRRAHAQFGRDHLPAVGIQLQHIRDRLDAFARWQAAWRGQGWRIERIEKEEGADRFDLKLDDGRTMKVGGRIDRIDRNEQTGQYLVLDYKTSDSPKDPDKAHRAKGEWVDLQLPLYRHLARRIGIKGPMQVGYIVLPKNTDQFGKRLAEWTEEELVQADDEARRVAGLVLDQQFWPPADDLTWSDDELAAICQAGVFDRRREGEPGGAA